MNSSVVRSSGRMFPQILMGLVILLFAFFVGKLIPTNPLIAVPLALVPVAIMLLFKNQIFLMLAYLFIFYEGGGFFPLDKTYFIPGIGKMSDLFAMVFIGYILLLVGTKNEVIDRIKRNVYFKPIMFLFLYWIFVWVYTVLYWHDDPLLAFRFGRKYFLYGFPVLAFVFIEKGDHWKLIERFAFFLIYAAFFTNILDSFLHLEFVGNISRSSEDFGVFKSFAFVKFLNSLFFARYLWIYAHQPTRKNFIKLVLIAVPFIFYLFRGLIAGLIVGLFVMSAFMLPRARSRTLMLLIIGGGAGLFLAVFAAALISGNSVGDFAAIFVEDYLGDIGRGFSGEGGTGNTFTYRMDKAASRLPLFFEHPWFGIGYISPWGTVAWGLYMRGGMPLGDVDSGWLDVLMRLGAVGTVVLLGFYAVVIKKIVSEFRYFRTLGLLSLDDQSWMMGTLVIMVQVLVALVSSANITFPATIITIGLAISYCMKVSEEKKTIVEKMHADKKALIQSQSTKQPPEQKL